MKKAKETTTTFLAEQALREADDFVSASQVAVRIGRTKHVTHSALIRLRKRNVADAIVQGGVGYWFALPKECDDRSRIVEDRAPESVPRKNRGPRKIVINDTEHELTTFYVRGARACMAEIPWINNPFKDDSARHQQWSDGHTNEAAGCHVWENGKIVEGKEEAK